MPDVTVGALVIYRDAASVTVAAVVAAESIYRPYAFVKVWFVPLIGAPPKYIEVALVVVTVAFVAAMVGCINDIILLVVAVPDAAVDESVNVRVGILNTAPFNPFTVFEKLLPSHIFFAKPTPPELIKLPVEDDVAAVVAVILICVFVLNVVPAKLMAPDVDVRFNAPVVRVNPLDKVNGTYIRFMLLLISHAVEPLIIYWIPPVVPLSFG